MAIVCHQCGDVGYSDLLVYCCLCHKAAQHQYCLDIIPDLDDDIEWTCEDCNFRTKECVNAQHLERAKIDVDLSNKENIVISNDRSSNDVCAHEHNIKEWGNTKRRSRTRIVHEHEIKTWGNTRKRSLRSIKHTFETCHDFLRDELTSQSFECSKLNDGRRKLIMLGEDDELIAEFSHLNNGKIKLILPNDDDESRDKFPQPNDYRRKLIVAHEDEDDELIAEFSHLNNGKRKLILPHEDDESRDEFPQPSDHRRKLIIAHEDEDDESPDGSMIENKINILRKRVSLDPSSKEDEDDNLVVKSLKEVEVSIENNKMSNSEVQSVLPNADSGLTTKAMSKDDLVQLSSGLPLIVHNYDSLRSQSDLGCTLAMPISWRGWFKIRGRAYGPLIARLSPKVGEKAWNAAKFLPHVIQLTMVSKSRAWPESFKMSPPTDDHIALTFFPPDSRVEKMVDQLVQEVIGCDLLLKVALDVAELLIFPSNLLPENYKRYQGKYYLWGAFKRKDSEKNAGETRISQTDENSEQTVPSSSIKSEVQLERDGKEMVLEGDKPKEKCLVMDEDGDTVMGDDRQMKELNGCLELFPTQVENIALRLKTGDGKQGVDLELSLSLPCRQ